MATPLEGSKASEPAISRYLDPEILNRVDRLELGARMLVEGILSGTENSPYHGYSVEFAQHREYNLGDDPRHLDWKVFSKTGRFFVKQYDVKTNYTAYILHDSSESMAYGSPLASVTKQEYANFLTAALSFLMVRQGHAVGLGVFNDQLAHYLEPRKSFAQIQQICALLEQVKSARKTHSGRILHEFAERIPRKGLVILVSDGLDDPDQILEGLGHLRFAGHEVIFFLILDPYELKFPFEGAVQFEGLETTGAYRCHPRLIRMGYLEALNAHLDKIKEACDRHLVDYVLLSSEQPLEQALGKYLQSRALARVQR